MMRWGRKKECERGDAVSRRRDERGSIIVAVDVERNEMGGKVSGNVEL